MSLSTIFSSNYSSSCLNLFKLQPVSELDFAYCSLEGVPSDIFAYERTLERLHLECNNIRDLPRELFNCQGWTHGYRVTLVVCDLVGLT